MSQTYVGVVEDRTTDPLKMGRCKVRVIGIHTDDKVILPTNDLPWAMPIVPLTSASMNGIGDAPVGPVEGSYVIVTFLDGDDKQKPIIWGTVPGAPVQESAGKAFQDPNKIYPKKEFLNEPDLNRLARNQKIEETVVPKKEAARHMGIPFAQGGGTWNQPTIPYATQYPYNHVFESESGHIQEFDDTPHAERIHTYHRSGTYTEIDANGTQVNRIVGSGYQIVDNDGYIHISGNCVINVGENANIIVSNDAHVNIGGKANVKVTGDTNLECNENISMFATKTFQVKCKDYIIDASESVNVKAGGDIDVKAGGNIKKDSKKSYTNTGQANPDPIVTGTWNTFAASSLAVFPDPPSRAQDKALAIEGMTTDEMIAAGVDPKDPTIAPVIDPATGQPASSVEETSTVKEKPAENKAPIDCENVDYSTNVSKYHTIKSVMFPASGGSIKAQHNLTACQIVANMQRVGTNVIDPIWSKYGTARLTSFYRVAGNQYSMTNGKISRHELGLAVDIQFTDCKTYEQYLARASELAQIVSAQKIIIEVKGSLWIHIQMSESGESQKAQMLTLR
jgi:hypothetical protein